MKATIAAVVRPGYRGDPHLAGWQYRPVSTLRRTGFHGFGYEQEVAALTGSGSNDQ